MGAYKQALQATITLGKEIKHMKVLDDKQQQAVNKRLKGKIALVTGGSRGIGTAIAKRLAEEGATVALTYSKNKGSAEEVLRQINQEETRAYAYKADVASDKEVNQLIDQIKRDHGKLDILINNAGVWEGGSLEDVEVEQFDRVFDVNVRGVIATTKAALEILQDNGRIINISSVAATFATPGMSIYSASKAALDSLTRIWAQELGARKITVNGVAPGTTATDMYHQALSDEAKAAFNEKTALKRVGEPEDIAAVVAFLASPDGGWVTGKTIAADGGINI